MKRRVGYLLLIIISIVGSRLIFGRDYHLNSESLKEDNLYVYNIFDKKVLATYVDEEEFYYVSIVKEDKKNNQYKVVKYNLTGNKREEEYVFNSNKKLVNVNLFKQDGHIYLTSGNSEFYYKFDNDLNVIKSDTFSVGDIDLNGIYKDKVIYTINNEIFYDDKAYDIVPVSCGKNTEIIYDRDTYLHFYNSNTGFGCLYNIDDKKIEYLDYENVDIVKDRLLEYQSNRLSFKYNGTTYYFNDITESNNLKIHDSGDYLFTIDSSNNKLRIYNIESKKIIYEKSVLDLKGAIVNNIIIDDYVFFLLDKDGKVELYVWDYLKETRKSIDMINYDEKEYKFKNNELKEEIKNNYNIDVNIYDQAVEYFDKYYVIPSYDDILINSRLLTLKEELDKIDKEEISSVSGIRVLFDKNIISSNQNKETTVLTVHNSDGYILAINITNDSFKDDLMNELLRLYPNLTNNE